LAAKGMTPERLRKGGGGLTNSGLCSVLIRRMALIEAREAVIRNLVPGRTRGDKGMELRPDTRLAVERAESDCDFFARRPLRAKEARATD